MNANKLLEFELLIYFVIWMTAVLYSIFCFSLKNNQYFQYYSDEYSDFKEGWNFLSRKQDVADFEWQTLKYLMKKLYSWVILSISISEILRKLKLRKLLQIWQITITLLFIIKEMGSFLLMIILLQPLIFTLFAYIGHNKYVIWLCTGFALFVISIYKHFSRHQEFLRILNINEHQAYITVLTLFWMNLRCVSYYLDLLDTRFEPYTFLSLLSYILYLPTVFCGPFIPYKDFKECYNFKENFAARLWTLLLQVFRFGFWLFFAEFCLHFIYVNAAGYHPEWVTTLDSWSLYGYGYTMGQFFHIKYLVIYGLATSFSKFENIIVPSLPLCIGRIHLYSDMWRFFDAGFYKFLMRYIYTPIFTFFGSRPLASLICFIFVYGWHGIDNYILIWVMVNYIEVITEKLATWINKNYLETSSLVNVIMGAAWFRRFTCMIASPLLAVSAISNFYFFAGTDIGHIFLLRFLQDNFLSSVTLLGALYCCCQVSTELRLMKKKL